MFNKYEYLKTNDKKVLHKVKKQWVTVSLALLMAIGGGVVATHVSANAATTETSSVLTPSAMQNIQTNVNHQNQLGAAYNQATDPIYNQNIHYNAPQGNFGDVETVSPRVSNNHVNSYDVYAMYDPTGVWPIQWGRFNTSNFSQFKPLNNTDVNNNIAIPSGNNYVAPDNTDGNYYDKLASGSLINNNGKLTHDQWNNPIAPNATVGYFLDASGLSMAYSNDGKQFHAFNTTPIINQANYGIGGDFLRDPFVIPNPLNHNEWDAYVAGGGSENIYVFTSTNGVNWNYNPNNTISLHNSGVTETPDIRLMNGKPVLFTSCQPNSNGQGHVYYTLGHFNNNGIFVANDSTIHSLDDGMDNYAGNYTSINPNTVVGVFKLQNWAYGPKGNNEHRGSFTLSRIVQQNGNNMEVTPIDPGSKYITDNQSLNSNDSLTVAPNKKLSLNFNQPVTHFNINLKRQSNDNDDLNYSFDNGTLAVHRNDTDLNSWQDMTRQSNLGVNSLSNIEFYLDNDSIEAYIPELHKIFTWADYTGTHNANYQMTVDTPAQANVYGFNLNQAPQLNDINSITSEYSADKNELNNDTNNSNSKALLSTYFNDIQTDINNANNNISKVNAYKVNNDARQHVFIALANKDMDMANTKLYQANIQLNNINNNLNSAYTTNDYAYDLTPDSFTNVDGFLTAHSWYRPKGIHQNGTNWRPSQRTNSNDYHDFRPVLMHWWPNKNTQVDYLNYMHQNGMISQSFNNFDNQNQLNQAANEVQDNIEKQISQNGNNGMNNATRILFNNFINSEPQWNMTSEDPGGYANQNGYFAFENSSLTPWANSNYREYNRSAGTYNRQHNNHNGLEFLLGNDIDTSNPAVLAENINNLYYILNIGSVRNNDAKLNIHNLSNFDGIREDATGSTDYDWTDSAAHLMNDMYHRNHNDLNADNHLMILEDDGKWIQDLNAPSNNRGALSQDQELLNKLAGCLLGTNNQPFNIANSIYANRSNDYTEDQAQPNYSRIGYHDNLQFIDTIQGMIGNQSDYNGLENSAKKYDDDAFNTIKHYGQYNNFPAAYAIMLTNKDTVPEVFYGDLYEGYKPYMTTKTPYFDAITTLLKARKKYVAGGQQMNTYDNGHILSSVRFGKDNKFTDSYGGHQILQPTDDAHTSNNPTTGIAIIVNNDYNLNPSNNITVNMGAAHGNQEYKLLMISSNTSDGFSFDSPERLTTNAQGQLVIPANDLRGFKNPQNSGSLSVWVPANAPENQDARTLTSNSTPKDNNDKYIYHSNATLDSHVLYESFSAFLPLNNNNFSNALQNQSNIKLLHDLGITDFRFPPYYTPVQNDTSFIDATMHNGYAFQDRYDLGITKPNKYGSINDLLRENVLLHQAGIHTLADVVDNQLYDLPNKEIVPVKRVDWAFNPYPYGSTNYINHDLYDDNTDSSNSQLQYQYGGKYLKQLDKYYHDLFTTPMVSTNQTLPDNIPIKNWSAKYMNGSNIQGHGADNVLRDASNKYYMVNNTGHSYVPTAFASINQQTNDNYAQAGASAADAQIVQHQKASVANSVAQANQKAAQNAAHAADENILNQQKASVANSVRAANQQKANQAAQQTDQRIAQQQRTSVANSVAAANIARADHAAQIADQNIINQQKQSVANSINAANQRTATSAANSADKNIESSIANSYAKSADNSIANSEAKNASQQTSSQSQQSVTPFIPMNNVIPTPIAITSNSVTNNSDNDNVMSSNSFDLNNSVNTSSNVSKGVKHRVSKPVMKKLVNNQIPLLGLSKRTYFYQHDEAFVFTNRMKKRANVLQATVWPNHHIVYRVRIGKRTGYMYGYLKKLVKPELFTKRNMYIHVGKRMIKLPMKRFNRIKINHAVRYAGKNYVKYYVNYGRKRGVIYGKLPNITERILTNKGTYSKYYQVIPKRYHYVNVKKPLLIYNNKHFTKRNHRGSIRKGITIRVKRLVRDGKMTRFELMNGRYITGLKSFTKLVK